MRPKFSAFPCGRWSAGGVTVEPGFTRNLNVSAVRSCVSWRNLQPNFALSFQRSESINRSMNQANKLEVAVFGAALQLPADQRAAYLEKACGTDSDLRRRVENLLGAADRAGTFMRQSAVSE